MMHTLRVEIFANNIFAIYGLICKNLLGKNKMLLWKTLWMLWKTQRKRTKTGHDLQNFVLQNCFGLMNHKNKFCKNFFLSLIGSTAFKLSDLPITFLFFRLFDNALMKAYSLYGRGGAKKSFKETKWVSE